MMYASVLLIAVASLARADVCEMEDSERYDCWDAEFPLNQETCEKRGCCWAVHEVPGIPWCYWRYGERPEVDAGACAEAAAAPRRDCAPPGRGMNAPMCATRGCCWEEGASPPCFYAAGEGPGSAGSDEGGEFFEEVAVGAGAAFASLSAASDGGKRHQSLETAFSQPVGADAPPPVRKHTEGFGSGEERLPQRVSAWRRPEVAAARAAAAALGGAAAPPSGSPPLPRGAPPADRNAAWAPTVAALGAGASPVAPEATTVTVGAARFTVLSDGLVRAEWSPHEPPVFHDAGTLLAVNRVFPGAPPDFTVSRESRYEASDGAAERTFVTITTPALTVRYYPAAAPGGAFTAASLSMTVKSTGFEWRPGAKPSGSLHGTIRTLDRVGKPLSLVCAQAPHVNDTHCVEGVLSRDGWAVVDDSLSPRWGPLDTAWPWVGGAAEDLPFVEGGGRGAPECGAAGWDRAQCIFGNRVDAGLCEELGCCFDGGAAAAANGHAAMWNYVPWCFHPTHAPGAPGYTDLYLFGRGRDYTGALRDFRALSGPVPQLPRYALGPMFSRWMGYHDFEEREIVATYARNSVPLDVMIVDMDVRSASALGPPLFFRAISVTP
jgi:hypothetical protein